MSFLLQDFERLEQHLDSEFGKVDISDECESCFVLFCCCVHLYLFHPLGSSGEDDENIEDLYCVACDKFFRTPKA